METIPLFVKEKFETSTAGFIIAVKVSYPDKNLLLDQPQYKDVCLCPCPVLSATGTNTH